MKNGPNTYLITGSTGRLGKAIVGHTAFKNDLLLSPARAELDITDCESVREWLFRSTPDVIIHCAALARMSEAQRDPSLAIEKNIVGTCNLVMATHELHRKTGHSTRFVHISTDGVYASREGAYNEASPTHPYNVYGWTKLGAETAVNTLRDFVIIRTRFFDPSDIAFLSSPVDVFTSKIPVNELVEAIHLLARGPFKGTINVGRREKVSEFEINREYKHDLTKTSREEIYLHDRIELAPDASMNTSLWLGISERFK